MPSLKINPLPKNKPLYRRPLVKNGSESPHVGEYARFVAEFVDAAKRFPKLGKWKNELSAVATHWLLSGGDEADFFGAEFRRVWNEFVSEYGIKGYQSLVSEGNQLVLPFGITLGEIPFPPPARARFTFIDLFAGIGGFRIALQKNGGRWRVLRIWEHELAKKNETRLLQRIHRALE